MNWITRDDKHLSAPYRIYRSVQGWDAWIYTGTGGACLGKGFKTIDLAKQSCEQHRAKEAA
jgi:hypothetical protein